MVGIACNLALDVSGRTRHKQRIVIVRLSGLLSKVFAVFLGWLILRFAMVHCFAVVPRGGLSVLQFIIDDLADEHFDFPAAFFAG